MMAPCSVNATGGNLGLRCLREPVTGCDRFSASTSAWESLNMKSAGNRSALRFTAWFRTLVPTPYREASCASSSTRWPRRTRMERVMSWIGAKG